MSDIHDAIIQGLAEELGATCRYHNSQNGWNGWELDWDWNILGPPIIMIIHDGKLKIETPTVNTNTFELADPNLLKQLRTTIKKSYKVQPIIYD